MRRRSKDILKISDERYLQTNATGKPRETKYFWTSY
jgi:hypothetical protein